jgi:4-amino-4-deoxy-L-arabinose transferase-like glycosyltransferase
MKPREILLLFLVLGIALFFRFYRIADLPPGLYPDEAMNGSNAEETLQNGGVLRGKVFYPENNGREGLFINIQAAFLRGLTPPEGTPEPWMLRLPSAIFGFFTVLGVFFLARELFRRHPDKLGRLLSLARFVFIATYRGWFRDRLLAELLPPLLFVVAAMTPKQWR